MEQDFPFLTRLIQKSYGEFDLSIRSDYFNIYYKGNSLAKIEFRPNGIYRAAIHKSFFTATSANNPKLYLTQRISGDYSLIDLSAKQLHPFFQKKHLTQLASKIKTVNNGEEIGFEQALITDNLNNAKLIFIDRQITDYDLNRKRIDLLALKQVDGNKYSFLVSEVKLGNNPELKSEVASQLQTYIDHINKDFSEYKKCYEIQYEQKKRLGLITNPIYTAIDIVQPTEGIIIVGGYSGIAKSQIQQLTDNYPHLTVKHFTYEL